MRGLTDSRSPWQALAAATVLAIALFAGSTASAANMTGNGGGPPMFMLGGPPRLFIAPSSEGHCQPPDVYSAEQHRCVPPNRDRTIPSKAQINPCQPPDVYSAELKHCVRPTKVETPTCHPPDVYSLELKRCIKPREATTCDPPDVYSAELRRCVRPPRETASCIFPMVKQGRSCVCAPGYSWGGDGCIRLTDLHNNPPVLDHPPGDGPPPPVIITTPPPVIDRPPVVTIDVTHIQQCLLRLGYDPGPANGVVGPTTRSAFRAYQQENGLAGQPFYLGDQPTQAKLYQMCDTPAQQASLPVAPPPPGPGATPVKTGPARCLDPDLYDLLKTTYGKAPTIQPCTPQTAACVPRPLAFDEAKLQATASAAGVNWCSNACIRLGSYLPLTAIQAIEAAAGVTTCAAPPALCYLPGRPVVEKQVEIRTIYKDLPVGAGNEGNIAVVIGNETYRNDITPHVYGHADADAVVQLLTEQLGYRKDNIIDLRDAGLADFQRIFGTADNPAGELAGRLKAEGQSPGDVIVYISSHGLARQDGGAAYLLPVDGKPDDLDHTGYPVTQLYANLGKAGARTIMLMLEATFGTAISDAIDAPNIPQLDVATMPESPIAGLAVFTASDRDQHALEDPEYGIGLFTRYMIAGLAGDADSPPVGNGDKRIDTVELYVYTADKVRTAARKSFGVEQKPILSKIDNLLVGTLAAK